MLSSLCHGSGGNSAPLLIVLECLGNQGTLKNRGEPDCFSELPDPGAIPHQLRTRAPSTGRNLEGQPTPCCHLPSSSTPGRGSLALLPLLQQVLPPGNVKTLFFTWGHPEQANTTHHLFLPAVLRGLSTTIRLLSTHLCIQLKSPSR